MSNKQHKCQFCKTGFAKESTLSAHMCIKKKRYIEKDIPERRIAFSAYLRFYELCNNSKKQRTVMDFIESSLYTDFYRFGRFMYLLNPIYPDQYVDFVITSGTKIKEWTSDRVYDLYLEQLMKKEPVEKAIERSVLTMSDWSNETGRPLADFFEHSTPSELSYYIKSGKISPWLFYATDRGNSALSKLNEEQVGILSGIINPTFWINKLQKNKEEYIFASEFLESVGL